MRQQQHKKQNQQRRGSRAALCCSCRLSVSSSEEPESATSSSTSSRYASVSSLAHAMVQERLDQMIKETHENNQTSTSAEKSSSSRRHRSTKFVLMVALEKRSDDPREDFRASMVEMITANQIDEPRGLRSLLDYYVSVNSEDCHGVILEVFHEVCSHLFMYSCRAQY